MNTSRRLPLLALLLASAITCIGDVHVLQRPNAVYLRVVDNEGETRTLARSRFPVMFASFEYVKALAGC